MGPITIVPYDNSLHHSQVVALWETVFDYNAAHNNPGLTIAKKVGVNDGLFFVAARGDKIVGTVMAGYDGHRGWIYSVAVLPSRQRQGIGSRLVSHAERALISKGCVKINLQTMEGNDNLTKFYISLGYSVEKRVSMGKRILI